MLYAAIGIHKRTLHPVSRRGRRVAVAEHGAPEVVRRQAPSSGDRVGDPDRTVRARARSRVLRRQFSLRAKMLN